MRKMAVWISVILIAAFAFGFKTGDWYASDQVDYVGSWINTIALTFPIETKTAEKLDQISFAISYAYDLIMQREKIVVALITDKNYKVDTIKVYTVDSKEIKLIRESKKVENYEGMVTILTNAPEISIRQYVTDNKIIEFLGELSMKDYIMVECIYGDKVETFVYSTKGLMEALINNTQLVLQELEK